ncbi:hypothetical protein [Pandoraea soli]
MKTTIVAALAVVASASAVAFDVDGFHSGMTVSKVAATVQSQGWALEPNRMTQGAYLEAHYDANGKVTELGPANFSFCDGRLIAYTRSLDFDTEYAPKLRDLIGTYGNQTHIEVDQYPWNGPGGGYITAIRTHWSVGRERVDLSFEPEEHTGDGALKHYRAADVSYVLPGVCSKG